MRMQQDKQSNSKSLNSRHNLRSRFLNRDGSFNIIRVDVHTEWITDLYHSLLSTTWAKFFGLVLAFYIILNTIFAVAYFFCGRNALQGIDYSTELNYLLDCFFFSIQTFATIGYGRINPMGLVPNLLVAFEALIGLLGLALVTGLLFSRFSKPTTRIDFSKMALVTVMDGVPCLNFRMANRRLNQIVEARVQVTLIRNESTLEGYQFRNFQDLALEKNFSPMFALTWLVVHPIHQFSPLYQKTLDDLREMQAEILVTLTGIDETFAQTVIARFSYTPDEIQMNARFEDMIDYNQEGKILVSLLKIHDVVKIDEVL